jgi:hypothetical protein
MEWDGIKIKYIPQTFQMRTNVRSTTEDANRHVSIRRVHSNAAANLEIRCPSTRKHAKVSTFTSVDFSFFSTDKNYPMVPVSWTSFLC